MLLGRHAVCPCCKNTTFTTVAHVAQDWVVDEKGNFISAINNCTDIVAPPDPDNIWCCTNCGAEAIFVDDETG